MPCTSGMPPVSSVESSRQICATWYFIQTLADHRQCVILTRSDCRLPLSVFRYILSAIMPPTNPAMVKTIVFSDDWPMAIRICVGAGSFALVEATGLRTAAPQT